MRSPLIKRNLMVQIIAFTGVWAFPLTNVLGQPGLPPLPNDSSIVLSNAPPKHEKTGLIFKDEGVSEGYVLVATEGCTSTYLINNEGFVVHEWNHERWTAKVAYLLPNGNLLHTVRSSRNEVGNTVEELTWDGDLVWEYRTDQTLQRMHHDIERLPNGNTLVTVWERKSKEEYVAAGRNPETVPGDEMWVDAIYEVEPTGKTSGEVVWRWSAWDHIIQNFDDKRSNYGDPSEHPQRIDLNQLRVDEGEFKQLSDWLHINAVSYNPDRDEIILSPHAMSEMWVVSKNTGKLIYRWGNPRRYGKGSEKDRVFFNQHDPHRIADGLRGAGNYLIFNNNIPVQKGEAPHSSVLEVKPPLTSSGQWPSPTAEGVYPPCEVVWEYTGPPDARFYAPVVSNAQRLESGGTLVSVGAEGYAFELDSNGKRVWEYVNPIQRQAKLKKLEKWNSRPPPDANMFFRLYKYPPDYAAFLGHELSPKKLLEKAGFNADDPSPAMP